MAERCRIFLIEDCDDDALLIRRAVAHSPKLLLVHHAKNAKEAVSYLQGAGVYADRERYLFPNVLVLDLEMQNEDGFEVLQWLKSCPLGSEVKAVALAAREHPHYLSRAAGLGARCCLVKPVRESTVAAFASELESWCHSAPKAKDADTDIKEL